MSYNIQQLGNIMTYHIMVGSLLLLTLRSLRHARYLVISTMLFCLLIGVVSHTDGRSSGIEVLSVLSTLLVSATAIINLAFFTKAMKSEGKRVVGAILACMSAKGTKDERRKMQEGYFDFKTKG